MKLFLQRGAALSRMSTQMKLLSVMFVVLVLAGYGVGVALWIQKAGTQLDEIAMYYRGSEDGMVYAKSAIELLETSHFHLFMIPLAFLVVSHLLTLSVARAGTQTGLIAAGWIAITLDLATPWLIRYASAWFVPVKLVAMAGLGLVLALTGAIVLLSMLPAPTQR